MNFSIDQDCMRQKYGDASHHREYVYVSSRPLRAIGAAGIAVCILSGLAADSSPNHPFSLDPVLHEVSPSHPQPTVTITVTPTEHLKLPYTSTSPEVLERAAKLDDTYEGVSTKDRSIFEKAVTLYEVSTTENREKALNLREKADSMIWQRANEAALRHNFHLSDPSPYRKQIATSNTYDEIAHITSSYCRALGFECQFLDNTMAKVPPHNNSAPIARNDPLTIPRINDRAIMLITSLSVIPREFFDVIRLKNYFIRG